MAKIKTTVGRTEIVSFPELGIETITAKIDTGAYSTAIHTHKMWEQEGEGNKTLYFQLLDPSRDEFNNLIIKTTSYYKKKVRSSNGRIEERFIIKTPLVLGGLKRITHLSLTNREEMRFPVLIGRKVLKMGFLVDVSKTNVVQPKK